MAGSQLTIDTSESLLIPLPQLQDRGLATASDTDTYPHTAGTNSFLEL